MNITIKKITFLCKSCFWLLAIKVSSLFKVSFIVGSFLSFFSAYNVVAPLAGAFGGLTQSIIITTFSIVMSVVSNKAMLAHLVLSYHIPTFFASMYWWYSGALIRLVLPLVCMFLFILHPIGIEAWVYSLYWLIPVIIHCTKRHSIFMSALGSTFIAHAVGSVIWLYTVPMNATQWLALIPIVALERFAFALGMFLLHGCIQRLVGFSKSKKAKIVRIFCETADSY
jgi:hypothetical protein